MNNKKEATFIKLTKLCTYNKITRKKTLTTFSINTNNQTTVNTLQQKKASFSCLAL